MGMIKSRQILSGRSPIKTGLDFSVVESLLTNFNTTPGTTIKFRGGATMGFNYVDGEWTNGIKVVATLTEGTLSGSEYKGKYSRAFEIAVNTISEQDGHPQGGLYVTLDRDEDYGHSGGSPDCGIRAIVTNYATCASGGVRGMDIMAYARGVQANVHGALITARVRSTGSGSGPIYGARIVTKCQSGTGGFSSMHALEVADESDGVVCAANSIVYIEKQSNSYTGATRAGVEIINNCNASYSKAITYGVYLKSGASGSNITNVFGFDSADGTDGFTAGSGLSSAGNIDGYFRVYDVATGQALYVHCYDAVPT